jgi:hypothetical protein
VIDDVNEPEAPEPAESDILALVEIWRTLDFPAPVTWEDESC